MRLKRRDAFPLFDNDNNVLTSRSLNGQAAHGVDGRKVLEATALRPYLGNDLAELDEKVRPLSDVQFDRGKDDDHECKGTGDRRQGTGRVWTLCRVISIALSRPRALFSVS